MDIDGPGKLREFQADYRWDGVAVHPYKDAGDKDGGSAPFRAISRQVLFSGDDMASELRYFEMAAGGYSTLERHQHAHAVMILRGHGHCLLGNEVRPVKPFDLISIPGWTWHQFRATEGEPLGFLCMVNRDRDKPQLPTEQEFSALAANPEVAAFLTSSG
jgi:quercetin dioxygenase-like cupin family protein